jgi:hypothetical protein
LQWIDTTRKLININGNTDTNIHSVNCNEFSWRKYSLDIYRGNYSGKKILKIQKIWCPVIYTNRITDRINSIGKLLTLFIISITKGITNRKFHRYFLESSKIVHFQIALLITVLYRQNHWRVEVISVIWRISKKFWLNWKFKLNITYGITDGLKSRQWYLVVSEKILIKLII